MQGEELLKEELNIVESVLNVAQKAGLINDLNSAAKVAASWNEILFFIKSSSAREKDLKNEIDRQKRLKENQ